MRNTVKVVVLLLIIGFRVQAGDTAGELVSLSFKKGSLESVLKEIRRQTGYLYALQDQWKGMAKPIDISVKRISLDEALNIIFKDQPFTYAIVEKTIIVKAKERENTSAGNESGKIGGMVYNESGEPLSGANITVKETNRGTITNARGEFELSSVSYNSTLLISYVGYATERINIKNPKDAQQLKIYLRVAKNELDKVVIQAYGTTTQRLATGNIGTVTAEDIAKQPVMNVLEAVQGQVPGAIVTNTSGYASAPIKVEIRGRNTISPNFPSDPLYIIDGVPLTVLDIAGNASYSNGSPGFLQNGINGPANGQSPLFSLNPADIQSIEVLKDADATAIYGSRGSNGVILITTKKGHAGKASFDINAYSGVSLIADRYKMLNTTQYVAMREEALANDGQPVNVNTAADLVSWDTTRYSDWQKYLWGGRLGKTTNVQSDLSGGDAQNTFRIGAGLNERSEITALSGQNQNMSLSFNINHKSSNQRFGISLSGEYSYATVNSIFSPGAALLPPNAPGVYDSEGNLNYIGWDPLNNMYPFGSILVSYSSKTNFLSGNFTLNYEILKGLTLTALLGYNNMQNSQNSPTPITSQDPQFPATGMLAVGTNTIHNVIIEPRLEYHTYLGEGKVNILLGTTDQTNVTSGLFLSGNGYPNDLLLGSINNAPIKTTNATYGEYKYASIFGRMNFNWLDKYIVDLNARRDGSSKFGPGRQYGNFGSVAGAWIFTEEDWFKANVKALSFGKIRASYGLVGGDQIGNYAFINSFQTTPYLYGGLLPLVPIGHYDSLLQWQVNRKLEAAVDLGFLKDLITFEVAWYRNRCNDQLVPFPTPGFTGFPLVTANSPADVQNSGWEFVLNGKVVDTKRLKWNIKLNIGINRNKLLAYPNFSQSPYVSSLVIGKPLNMLKLLHYTGVDPLTGLYRFEDKNKDGQITIDFTGRSTDDRYIYDLSPKYDGGFTNSLTYRNWSLSAFFYFRKQIGVNALASITSAGGIGNVPTAALNRWQKPGDVKPYAKFTTNPYADPSYLNFQFYSDGVYTDASFVRLQNLYLSYSLSTKGAIKGNVANWTFYVKANNVLLITAYKGADPETQNFGSLPRPKIATVGLSCNF